MKISVKYQCGLRSLMKVYNQGKMVNEQGKTSRFQWKSTEHQQCTRQRCSGSGRHSEESGMFSVLSGSYIIGRGNIMNLSGLIFFLICTNPNIKIRYEKCYNKNNDMVTWSRYQILWARVEIPSVMWGMHGDALSPVAMEVRKAMMGGVAFNIHMSGTNRVCCVLHLENST